MVQQKKIQPPTRILIVGGGVYGLSTALHLATGPYKGHADLITIVDRSAAPPDTNAACYDMNKIIRADYTDPFYLHRAHDAVKKWRSPGWNKTYHESGFMLITAPGGSQESSVAQSYSCATAQGMGCTWYDGVKSFPDEPVVPPKSTIGYRNSTGGWAFSLKSAIYVRNLCLKLGVQFKKGNATELLVENNDVVGVKLEDGSDARGDLTVLCAGSWTSKIYPKFQNRLLPTGHCVATIQLKPEEMLRFDDVPVVFCQDTGFYIFPPTREGYMKMAIHGKGYVNPESALASTPCAKEAKNQVPEDGLKALRDNLATVYPSLKDRPFDHARVCWYCDTPSADWLIDYDDDYPSLFIASGDSGHAFKFLPTIGEYVVKGLQRRFDIEEYERWGLPKILRDSESHLSDGDSMRSDGVAKTLGVSPRAQHQDLDIRL